MIALVLTLLEAFQSRCRLLNRRYSIPLQYMLFPSFHYSDWKSNVKSRNKKVFFIRHIPLYFFVVHDSNGFIFFSHLMEYRRYP